MPSATSPDAVDDVDHPRSVVDLPEIIEDSGCTAIRGNNKQHAAAMPAARSLALQREAADAYEALINEALRLKAKVVERGDEDSAARLLCGECARRTRQHIRLWVAFKEGDMRTAWDRMVDAQQAWRGALRPCTSHRRAISPARLGCISAEDFMLFPHVALVSVA